MTERIYTESQVLRALAGLACVLTCPHRVDRPRGYHAETATLVDDDGGAHWECLVDSDWRCSVCQLRGLDVVYRR